MAGARIRSEVAPASAPGTMTLLTRLSKVVHRRSTEALLGMRMRQFHLLSYLRDHEGAGFVMRRRDPHDRRRHLVELTPGGHQAVERAERAQESVEDEVLAAL